MKSRYRCLCDHSLSMALAAIEVYNKPDFAGREQVFTILIVNAWEALAKAKILKDNGNRLSALYVKDGNRYKRNRRTKQPLTLDFLSALDRCPVPDVVKMNLTHLYDVRNAATHLSARSKELPQLVFSLGSAALQNYARLCADWFGIGLGKFNFYILPLGFSFPFARLSVADFAAEPEDVRAIIKSVINDEARGLERDGFFLTCHLEIALISGKSVSVSTDITARVDGDADAAVIQRNVSLLDQYPYSYTEAVKKIARLNPSVTRTDIQQFIKQHVIKGDPRYSAYNFRNNREKQRGPSGATSVLYNEDFVRLCVSSIQPSARNRVTGKLDGSSGQDNKEQPAVLSSGSLRYKGTTSD